MILHCDHPEKTRVGGSLLDICASCRAKNIATFHAGDHPSVQREHFELRRKLYLVRDLREPTMEDLT